MIDLRNEEPITLAAAARMFPPTRQGRPISLSAIFRWISDGIKGPDGKRIRLEAARMVAAGSRPWPRSRGLLWPKRPSTAAMKATRKSGRLDSANAHPKPRRGNLKQLAFEWEVKRGHRQLRRQ